MVNEKEIHLINIFINNLRMIKKSPNTKSMIDTELKFWENRLKGIKGGENKYAKK